MATNESQIRKAGVLDAPTIYDSHGVVLDGGNGALDAGTIYKIATWLAPSNQREFLANNLGKRTTGTWPEFTESAELQTWANSNGGTLWISGLPGSGKTVLASIVIKYLEERAKKSEDTSLAFVSFRYPDQASVRDIYATVTRQLLESYPENVYPLIAPLYDKHSHEGMRPSQAELLDLLRQCSSAFKQNFYGLLALDEASEEAQPTILEAFASLNGHLFVTSDLLAHLWPTVPNAVHLEFAASEKDIKLMAMQRIDSEDHFVYLLKRTEMRDSVVSVLYDKSQRKFLYAALYLESISRCRHRRAIMEMLDQPPADLHGFYAAAFKHVEGQFPEDKEIARLIFVWLANAFTSSLSVEEVQYGLATTLTSDGGVFDPDTIVEEISLLLTCCGLASVDQATHSFELIHYTARKSLVQLQHPNFPDPHRIIGRSCVTHLIDGNIPSSDLQTVGQLKQAFKDHPLLKYAYDFWAQHLQKSGAADAGTMILDFLEQCQSFPVGPWWDDNHPLDYLSPLQTAAWYGLSSAIDSLIQKTGADINLPTSQGKTALLLASLNGHVAAVQLLLTVPGINANAADRNGYTALMLARNAGHNAIVNLLLSHPGIDS